MAVRVADWLKLEDDVTYYGGLVFTLAGIRFGFKARLIHNKHVSQRDRQRRAENNIDIGYISRDRMVWRSSTDFG